MIEAKYSIRRRKG